MNGILMTFTWYRNERVQFHPEQLPFMGQLRQCGPMDALVCLNGTESGKDGFQLGNAADIRLTLILLSDTIYENGTCQQEKQRTGDIGKGAFGIFPCPDIGQTDASCQAVLSADGSQLGLQPGAYQVMRLEPAFLKCLSE